PAEVQQAIDQQKPILFVTDLQQHQLGWAAQYNPEQVTLLQFDQNAELNGNGELARRILRAAKQKITEHQPTDTLQPLPVAKIREGEHAELPTRAYHDDAGLDLYVSQPTQVPPGEFVDVPTNTAIQLPEGTWGLLQGRSSFFLRRVLLRPCRRHLGTATRTQQHRTQKETASQPRSNRRGIHRGAVQRGAKPVGSNRAPATRRTDLTTDPNSQRH